MSPGSIRTLALWCGRKVLAALLVLWGASLLAHVILRTAPGPEAGAPRALRTTRAVRPTQAVPGPGYGVWLRRALRADLGRSTRIRQGRPVAELLVPAARRSLCLAGAATLTAALSALGLAWARSTFPHARPWRVVAGLVHLGSALPVFLLVYTAVILGNRLLSAGARHGLWSLPAWFPFPSRDHWIPWTAAVAIMAVGDGLLADMYRRFSAELARTRSQDYWIGARLLGVPLHRLLLRAALPGLAAYLSRRTAFVLGSTVVLESALGWPGLGYLAWRAAAERDTPVLLGCALVMALLVRATSLAADALRYWADPRLRGHA